MPETFDRIQLAMRHRADPDPFRGGEQTRLKLANRERRACDAAGRAYGGQPGPLTGADAHHLHGVLMTLDKPEAGILPAAKRASI
jgi:hypothetical protein